MAVNILAANSARVEFGDIAGTAGLTTFTVSLTVKTSASTRSSGLRFTGQWGATQGAYLIQSLDTADVGFTVSAVGNVFCGRQTTGSVIATGTYRLVFRYNSSGPTQDIWLNGVSQTTATWLANNSITIANSTEIVYVGREQSSGTSSIDADFAEFALHSAFMPDDYCSAYGKGYSPAFYRKNGILYAPLINTGNLVDKWGGTTGTNTASTSTPHPSIIMPRGKQEMFIPAETVSI